MLLKGAVRSKFPDYGKLPEDIGTYFPGPSILGFWTFDGHDNLLVRPEFITTVHLSYFSYACSHFLS
jgi:hypothetical protein